MQGVIEHRHGLITPSSTGTHDAPPAVNGECLTRDERGPLGGEEDDSVGHLPHIADPPHGVRGL